MMSPAGGRHGRVTHNIGLLLGTYVRQENAGVVFAAETGFLLSRDPDTVRAPDVAFLSTDRFRGIEDDTGYLPIAPDLVAEVISPNDSFSDVESKAFDWLSAGTSLVLLVDPETQTLHVYRSATDIEVLSRDESFNLEDILPGWRFAVEDLFR